MDLPSTYSQDKLDRMSVAKTKIQASSHPKREIILKKIRKEEEWNFTSALRIAEVFAADL